MSGFGLFLVLFAALALALGLIWLLSKLTDFVEAGGVRGAVQRSKDRYTVNRSPNSAPYVMSRSPADDGTYGASPLQTDRRQTTDRPTMLVPTRAEMLDIFKVLRARGVKRDELRGPWRAAGLPLDNNLWTEATPPDDDTHITPIAGRPTRAQFEADPELAYQSPPN